MNKIIYAAYGSNLLKERFFVYIKGGVFKYVNYSGCRDKTEPEDLGYMFVPHRLYFAKKSSRWDNKGVAFLSVNKDPVYHTLVRLWKITQEQFEDLHNNEGKRFYTEILYLGQNDGLEIKTITGKWENEINPPSEEYIKILKKGIKETTGWSDKNIEEYLSNFIGKVDH